MDNKTSLISALLLLGACKGRAIPIEAPTNSRLRPDWTSQLVMHVDAIRACVELREAPRYVVFLDSLRSGATAVTTIDAYGGIENCAWMDGEVVRREPTQMSGDDVADAGGVLFSLGPTMPIVPTGIVLEEVLDDGAVVGWLYWPKPSEASGEEGEDDVKG